MSSRGISTQIVIGLVIAVIAIGIGLGYLLVPQEEGQQQPPQEEEGITVQFVDSKYRAASGGTSGRFHTGQDADIMLSGIDFNNTGGPLLFNHPSGIASDGQRLFLADTFNNRVLVWNTLPTGNVPPDLVLGQKDFISNNPGSGRDQMNWPHGVATGGGRLVVADVNNARVLIWNRIPTENGAPADLVLEGGGSYWKTDGQERLPGGAWGVWTNGEKLVVSNTWAGGSVLIWNTFPTRDNQPADLIIRGGAMGTPRHITSDGSCLIVGDHNAHVEGEPSMGSFFWKTFPSVDDQPYDFFMSKGFGWLRGAFLSDGRLLIIGGDRPELRIWNSFPQSADDEADLVLELRSANLVGHDYEGVAVVGNRIYFSQGNGNRVIGYSSVPTEPDQRPDFIIGSPDLETNTLKKNFFIQNGMPVSNGKNLFVSSDFDRKLYVWKNLPDESGAFPDIVYKLPSQPYDIALCGNTLAMAGERTVYLWKELPLGGNMPDTVIDGGIGKVTFQDLKGVALDNRYFYLADYGAGKVYIWEGLPDQDRNPSPKFTLSVNGPWRLDSDGNYLLVDAINDRSVKIYRIADLSPNAEPVSSVGGPERLNLPQAATVSHGHLFISDTSFNRVLVWENIEEAMAGKWPPDAILGKNNLEDHQPSIGRDKLFFPAGLCFDGSYLWVGEFKFSNRILRFSPS